MLGGDGFAQQAMPQVEGGVDRSAVEQAQQGPLLPVSEVYYHFFWCQLSQKLQHRLCVMQHIVSPADAINESNISSLCPLCCWLHAVIPCTARCKVCSNAAI